MQAKFLTLCVAAAMLAAPGVSYAQLGNGGAAYSEITGAGRWFQTMPKFVDAAHDSINANANLLTAVGMPEQAATLLSRAKELNPDATPGTVEEIMAMRSTAAAALAPKLTQTGVVLDDNAKMLVAKSIDAMARAVSQINALSSDLPSLKKMMRDAGTKARTGFFVAKSLSNYRKDMKAELAAAIAFAKANDVRYAPDADLVNVP